MNRLRKMEILEDKMFQTSVNILMNKKSGELVLDDELIGSRSNDVECKTLSHRKSGKEGPVVDAIADSHVGCLLGMQLRVKGESELDNVMKLFERFPTLFLSSLLVDTERSTCCFLLDQKDTACLQLPVEQVLVIPLSHGKMLMTTLENCRT